MSSLSCLHPGRSGPGWWKPPGSWLGICLLFLLAASLSGCAEQEYAGEVHVNAAQGWYPLGLHLSYLPDPEGELEFSQAVELDNAGQFIQSRSALPAIGIGKRVVWVSLTLHSDLDRASAWVLEIGRPFMDNVDVYIPQDDGTLALWQVGDRRPFSARMVPFRNFVFNLSLLPQGEKTIYVRLEHFGQIALDFTLWAPGIFGAAQAQDHFFLGMFYATLLAVLIYNTVLLISLREREPLHYYLSLIMFFLGCLFFVVDGLATWLIWPQNSWLSQASGLTLWALVSAVVPKMFDELLQLQQPSPVLHRLLNGSSVVWIALALVHFLAPVPAASVLIGIMTVPHLVLLWVGWILGWRRGGRKPGAYSLIWLIYFILAAWVVVSEAAGLTVYWKEVLDISRFASLFALAVTSLVVRSRYDRAWQMQSRAQVEAVDAAQKAETVIREQNELLAQRVALLSDELSAFLYTTILVSQVRDWQQTLLPALERFQRSLQSQAICAHFLDVEGDTYELVAQIGLPAEQAAGVSKVKLDLGVKETGNGALADSPALPSAAHPLDIPGYAHRLTLPIQTPERALGLLTCYRRSDPNFSPDQCAVAAALAEHLAAAVENQRLRLAAEAGAVIQERRRMARELHDSLNQSIYSLALLARASRDALEEGEADLLAENLADIEQQAFIALQEMRIMLHALRPPELEARGLVGALEDRFNMVERRMDLQAEVQIDENLALPAWSETEVYRIMIEALNNVVKHARAKRVRVSLVQREEQVELQVVDDGVGYRAEAASGGMGIENMRQRAASLGGSFEVSQQAEGGTRVCIVFPLVPGV